MLQKQKADAFDGEHGRVNQQDDCNDKQLALSDGQHFFKEMLDKQISRRDVKTVRPFQNDIGQVLVKQIEDRDSGRDEERGLEDLERPDQPQQGRSA